MDMTGPDFKWHTVEEIASPKGKGWTVQVIENNWWPVNENGQVAVYKNHYPQCNLSKQAANQIWKDHDLINIPYAFMTHDCKDYI